MAYKKRRDRQFSVKTESYSSRPSEKPLGTYVFFGKRQQVDYSDELPDCSDTLEKNISTTSSSASSTAACHARGLVVAQNIGHTRGLDINSPLSVEAHTQDLRHRYQQHSQTTRRSQQTLGGSTSTRPGVRIIILKTCDFVDISNTAIPTALGGSTTTSPPIVVMILR
jgi:hypothetical protein